MLSELKQEPQWAGLLGGVWFGVGNGWLGNHLRPSPLLLLGAQATLSGSPDLLTPRGFQSCLCVLTLGLSPSGPARGPHGIVTSGMGPMVKGPICQQHPLGPHLRKPSPALIFPH